MLFPAPRAAHPISVNHSLFQQYAPDQDALWDGKAILEAFGNPAQVPPGTGLGSSGTDLGDWPSGREGPKIKPRPAGRKPQGNDRKEAKARRWEASVVGKGCCWA